MNIKGTLLLALFALLSLNVSAQLVRVIEGDGKYVEKEIDIDHFTEISLTHAFNVIYTQDKSMARKVKIRAEENMMDFVQVVSKKGKLSLSMKKALNVDYGVVFVYCSSEELYKVRNMGRGVFEVNGILNTPKLDVEVGSNGQIKIENLQAKEVKASILSTDGDILLAGTTHKARYSIKFGGEIRADRLAAEEVSCIIFGNGSVGCSASQKLQTTFWGTGTVYYRGTPEFRSGGIGKGKVVPISD